MRSKSLQEQPDVSALIKSMIKVPAAFLLCGCLFGQTHQPSSTRSAKPEAATSFSVAYQQGVAAVQAGDLARAQAEFEQAVKLNPQDEIGRAHV